MKATRLLGIIFNKATENLSLTPSLTDVCIFTIESQVQSSSFLVDLNDDIYILNGTINVSFLLLLSSASHV